MAVQRFPTWFQNRLPTEHSSGPQNQSRRPPLIWRLDRTWKMAGFVAKYQIAIVICWIRPVLNATKLEIRYRQTRFFLDFANDGGNNTLSTFDMAPWKCDSRHFSDFLSWTNTRRPPVIIHILVGWLALSHSYSLTSTTWHSHSWSQRDDQLELHFSLRDRGRCSLFQ